MINESAKADQKHDTIPTILNNAIFQFSQELLFLSLNENIKFIFNDLTEILNRITGRLLASGLKKGDRICSISDQNIEACLLFWAAARVGIITVPIDNNWAGPFIQHVLDEIDASLIFFDWDSYSAKNKTLVLKNVIIYDGNLNSDQKSLHFIDWIGEPYSRIANEIVEETDPVVILFSSGSSGYPKGIILSHGSLCRSAKLIAATWGIDSSDRFLNLAEIYSMSGLRNTCVLPLITGNCMILSTRSERNNLSFITELIKKNSATILGTAPILIKQYLIYNYTEISDALKSLRFIISTGCSLPQMDADSFFDHYGIPIFNYYGLTETTGFCIAQSIGNYKHAVGSVGLPIGCEIKVLNEEGSSLPFNEVGELCIKSPNMMLGYFKNESLTKEVIKRGWFYTGDLALQREDGHIVLKGRKKYFIKNAYTEIIFPEEVELYLDTHNKIKESAVCGYISESGDERLAAFIVLKNNKDNQDLVFLELGYFLKEKLGLHKIPHRFIVIDSVPRNSLGKIIRSDLELFLKES